MPRPTPNSFLNDSFRRSRSAMTADMSTSLKVVSIAAVCCASTSRRAIVWRRLVMRTRSSVRARSVRSLDGLVGATGVTCRCDRAARRCDLVTCRCERHRSLDVLLRDATGRARALFGARSSSLSLAMRRAVGVARLSAALRPSHPLVPALLRRRRCWCAVLGGWCRRRRAAFIDDCQQFADLDVLAFLSSDAGDDAAFLCADLEIDLLSLELDDRLADFDAVSGLLQPPRDARLDDRFTKLWDDDVRHGSAFRRGQAANGSSTGPWIRDARGRRG